LPVDDAEYFFILLHKQGGQGQGFVNGLAEWLVTLIEKAVISG
jgi:hypothetical protein